MYTAKYIFQGCPDLFEGADPRGADIVRWHMAEEFEHRTVAHDAFAAISGNYFMRIYGLLYSSWHFGGFCRKLIKVTLEEQTVSSKPFNLSQCHCL